MELWALPTRPTEGYTQGDDYHNDDDDSDYNAKDDDEDEDDNDFSGGQRRGEAGMDGRPGDAEHQVHVGAHPRCHTQVGHSLALIYHMLLW